MKKIYDQRSARTDMVDICITWVAYICQPDHGHKTTGHFGMKTPGQKNTANSVD